MSSNTRLRKEADILSWAGSWDADQRGDRRRLGLALGLAVSIHAALLLVRLAGETVVLPTVDAVVHPRLETLAPRRPEVPQPPLAAREESRPEVRRIPVPAELAPPEPLALPEVSVFPIERPIQPAALIGFPEDPPLPIDAPVRFHGGMERPVRVAGSDPAYTEIARKVREEGVVILDAVIDETGAVTEIVVVKKLGFGLTESAVRAVGTWRFQPARLGDRPVAVRYTLTVRFTLR